jgi:uncharacterized protein YbjQ (UPF0145 family)
MDRGDSDPAHSRRLKSSGFTSALSINEFAACTALGLEPVALVQGYAVLASSPPLYTGGVSMIGQRFTPTLNQIGPYSYMNAQLRKMATQGYWQRYRCPHMTHVVTGEHLTFGANAEQLLMHSAWKRGYGAAFSRMLEQAKAAGAHGVIGVRDDRHHFVDSPAVEYRVLGTAVRVSGAPESTASPWTTHLAGQRLLNLIASGYTPIAAIVERTWIAVWPYCMTRFFLEGKVLQRDLMGDPVQEVDQVPDAKMKVVEIAMGHVRDQAKGDPVYGIDFEFGDEHLGTGAWITDVTVRASRLRRFDPDAEPLSAQTLLTLS